MSVARATRLAVWSWVAILALALVTMLLASLNAAGAFSFDSFAAPLLLVALTTVGAVVASRRPENPIGWVFLVTALLSIFGLAFQEYGAYALVTNADRLPGGLVSALVGSWLSNLGFGLLITFTLFLFPTGSIPSRGWRPVALMLGGLLVLATIERVFRPGPIGDRFPETLNPLGIASLAGVFDFVDHFSFFAGVLIALSAVVARFLTARGVERQQLKWFTYAVVVLIASMFVDQLIELVAASMQIPSLWSGTLESALTDLAIGFVLAAMGIAILRYRLYDIDIIINRTLVYGSLTVALAFIYWGSVVGLQALLRPIEGEGNDLAVVVSTLLIAGLFLPLHRAIQGFVDRRFYRRKYNAARTLESFSTTLRDEVDLATLAERLVAIVEETMQPAHVSLWLREQAVRKPAGQGSEGK